jgi:hypothetical protein
VYPHSAPSPAHLACSILFKVPFKGPIFFERLPGLGMTKHWQNQPCPIWIELESPGYMKLWDTNGVNQTCHIFFMWNIIYLVHIHYSLNAVFYVSKEYPHHSKRTPGLPWRNVHGAAVAWYREAINHQNILVNPIHAMGTAQMKYQWKIPTKYGLIWCSTSILGSWNYHWK